MRDLSTKYAKRVRLPSALHPRWPERAHALYIGDRATPCLQYVLQNSSYALWKNNFEHKKVSIMVRVVQPFLFMLSPAGNQIIWEVTE